MLRFLFLLTFFALLPKAHAQDPTTKIEVQFFAFRYAPKLQSVYLRTNSKSYEKVALSTANIVGPLKAVLNDGTVTLHSKKTNEDGETFYPVVGIAKIPRAITKALIILAPAKKPKMKHAYQTFVIDQKVSRFPPGSYKMVNLSPYRIRGAIGGTRFVAPPRRVTSFKTKGQPGDALPVLFQYKTEDRWRILTETRWAHSETSRMLLCAYLDPTHNRMRLRSIPNNTVPNKERPPEEQ